jgi:hypothetical protein
MLTAWRKLRLGGLDSETRFQEVEQVALTVEGVTIPTAAASKIRTVALARKGFTWQD